ncbi:MAG: hypothetical protein V4662_17675 [Verrucomicrobiota bacterium]
MTSSTILTGPCVIVHDGVMFISKGAVTVKPVIERFGIPLAGYPDIEQRVSNRHYEVSFTPAGAWDDLAVLFPYSTMSIGSQIFSGKGLTIWTRDSTNNKRVYSNAAVTKCPGVAALHTDTLLGDLTFTCILKEGGAPGDSDAYVTQTTDTFPDIDYDISKIITPVYTRSWGSSPFDAFNVDPKGIVYDFNVELRPQMVDGLGTVNMVLVKKGATAKFTPVGLTEAQIRTATGANTALGASPTKNNLIVAGTGFHVTLYSAQLMDDNLTFDANADRIGEITASVTQSITSGAGNPIYRIASAAP